MNIVCLYFLKILFIFFCNSIFRSPHIAYFLCFPRADTQCSISGRKDQNIEELKRLGTGRPGEIVAIMVENFKSNTEWVYYDINTLTFRVLISNFYIYIEINNLSVTYNNVTRHSYIEILIKIIISRIIIIIEKW